MRRTRLCLEILLTSFVLAAAAFFFFFRVLCPGIFSVALSFSLNRLSRKITLFFVTAAIGRHSLFLRASSGFWVGRSAVDETPADLKPFVGDHDGRCAGGILSLSGLFRTN